MRFKDKICHYLEIFIENTSVFFSQKQDVFVQNFLKELPFTSVNLKENALKVDLFLSHSWSCPSWKKLLATCHYLNLDLAIISSITANTMAVVLLVPWHFEQQKALKSRSWFAGRKTWLVLVCRVKVRHNSQLVV